MDEKRENTKNFKSPTIYRRFQDNNINNNIKYKNYYSNETINNINDLIMKEKEYYPNNNNNNKRMEINNDLLKKFNSERNIDNIYNINNINNFIPNNLNINNNNFEKVIKENISLKENIKKYKEELSSKDFEIEGYKEKVKYLLIKIKQKNYLLNSKMNSSESSNNSISIEQYITENNNLKKENKKLEQIIKLLKNNTKNLNSYDNKYYDYFNDNYLKEQNQNNYTINSFRLTFDKSKYLYNSLDNKYGIKESGLETNNLMNFDDNLFIKDDYEIKNLNKIIEELKLKNDYEYKKYKKEIEENNRKYSLLIKENEKIKGEILKKNESLEEKINEINVLKIKNELLINNYNDGSIRKFEEELRDNKIEIALKYRENEDLKAEISKIKKEKLNKENIIEELNEDIENLKEINENNKKEINEKNNNIENLIKNINDLEIKIKDIMDKNEKIKKENIMIKNKNNDNTIKQKSNNDKLNNNIYSNEEYDNIKKENEILKKKINQLNDCANDLNNQIKEKNIEINNLKEASYSLINKQKNEFERRDKNKNNKITPETYCIISQKKYNDLTWYLISNIFPNEKIVPKKYDNFRWVTGESIDPNLFQKFYNDEVKLNDIYSYIKKLQDKLDQKEEENKKNYKLKNNSESIKNETSSYFDKSLNKSNSYKNIIKYKINPYIDENKEFEKK